MLYDAKKEARNALVQNRNLSIVAWFVAAIIVLRLILDATSFSKTIQELSFLTLVFPALFFIINKMGSSTLFAKSLLLTLMYVIPLTFSFIFVYISGRANEMFAFVTFANVLFMFGIASLFASCQSDDIWLIIMRKIGCIATPFFVYVALTQKHAYVWGRWHPFGGHPNWWGMMGLGLAWCAFAYKNIFIKCFLMGLGLYFMILTQSRGSLVAFLPAFVFCSAYFIPITRKKLLLLLLILTLGGIIILFVSTATPSEVKSKFYTYFTSDILRLDDPNRGLSSGLSNRIKGFVIAWKAFLDSPLLGAGYCEYSFVHNGFLVILAEDGIFSFLGVITLFVIGLRGYIKSNHWKGFGYILSYIVLLLTFPRTFNINLVSLLFIMILMKGVALARNNKSTKPTNNTQLSENSIASAKCMLR